MIEPMAQQKTLTQPWPAQASKAKTSSRLRCGPRCRTCVPRQVPPGMSKARLPASSLFRCDVSGAADVASAPQAPASLCRTLTPDPFEPPDPGSWQSEILGTLPTQPCAKAAKHPLGDGCPSLEASAARRRAAREPEPEPAGIAPYRPPHRRATFQPEPTPLQSRPTWGHAAEAGGVEPRSAALTEAVEVARAVCRQREAQGRAVAAAQARRDAHAGRAATAAGRVHEPPRLEPRGIQAPEGYTTPLGRPPRSRLPEESGWRPTLYPDEWRRRPSTGLSR